MGLRGISMRLHHGISVGLPSSHGASVMFPWDFNKTSMGLPRSHGAFVAFPRDFHGVSMILPWDFEVPMTPRA